MSSEDQHTEEPPARRDAVDDQNAPTLTEGPTVFVSYRRDDTGDVVDGLSRRLRDDLGATQVFRDHEDLIAGEPWKTGIDEAIDESDAAIVLIGESWEQVRPNGSRRIDEHDDPVASEVRATLQSERCAAIPVLVDRTGVPERLPSDVAGLFELHGVSASRSGLGTATGDEYQRLLVGVWEALRRRVRNGVLVIGDGLASVDAVVEEMKQSKLIDARRISRYAAGACVVSARRLRRKSQRWPDAIVVTESPELSDPMRARIAALDDHPAIRRVSLVGAGVGVGLALAQVGGIGASTTFSASSGVAPAIPQIGTSSAASIASSVAGAGVAAKAAGVGILATVTAVIGIGLFSSSATAEAEYGYLDVRAAGLNEVGEPPDEFDPEFVYVTADIELTNNTRGESYGVPASVFTLETAGELAVGFDAEDDGFDLAPMRTVDDQVWFAFPAGTEIDDPVLVMREDGGEPLQLLPRIDRTEHVPIEMEGTYDTDCRLVEFGDGFASRNAGVTTDGDPRPNPSGTPLGRAREGDIFVQFDATVAEKSCGPASFFTLTGGGVNAVTAISVDGTPVQLSSQGIGQPRGVTNRGEVAFAVAEGSTSVLEVEMDNGSAFTADLEGLTDLQDEG